MCADFVNLTPENLAHEHLCCIIRSRKPHPGVEAKRQWLSDRLPEGHVFRKRNAKATVFIEYAPLETAWVPIVGDNYYYLYCLWVSGDSRGHGYGRSLMEYCLADAREKGRSGVCMLGAQKQKAWLADQSFARKFGFEVVDTTANGYTLLALSFDGTTPRFAPHAKKQEIERKELTIYYDLQCPYVHQTVETVRQYCEQNGIPVQFLLVDTLQKAKELPCVFNNWAVFYNGRFETVNLLDVSYLKRILKKCSGAARAGFRTSPFVPPQQKAPEVTCRRFRGFSDPAGSRTAEGRGGCCPWETPDALFLVQLPYRHKCLRRDRNRPQGAHLFLPAPRKAPPSAGTPGRIRQARGK